MTTLDYIIFWSGVILSSTYAQSRKPSRGKSCYARNLAAQISCDFRCTVSDAVGLVGR